METSIIIGWIGFIFSLFIGPAQLIKTIRLKHISGISVATYWFLLITCAAYLVRAIVIMEWIFILSNLFGVIVTLAMIILIYKYRDKE